MSTLLCKIMREETLERHLFGQRDTKVWASEPIFVRFEKGDAKVQIKIVEFDYGTRDEHVLIKIATNGPDCPNIQRGVNVFKQNELTQVLLRHMKMHRRELQRNLTPHRSTDDLLYNLTKTLQTFT